MAQKNGTEFCFVVVLQENKIILKSLIRSQKDMHDIEWEI
jgi:hypothetical protein